MILPMGTLIVIIYRLGLVAIWLLVLVVVSWIINDYVNSYQQRNPMSWIGFLFIIGSLIVAFVVHQLWRWVLGQKKKPKE